MKRITELGNFHLSTLEKWVDDRLLIAIHLLSEPNCSTVLQFMWPVMLFTSHVFLTDFRGLPYYYSSEDTLFLFLFPTAVPKLHIPLDELFVVCSFVNTVPLICISLLASLWLCYSPAANITFILLVL